MGRFCPDGKTYPKASGLPAYTALNFGEENLLELKKTKIILGSGFNRS